MAPVTSVLPAGTPNVPLHRHENFYWMRSRPVIGSSSSGRPSSAPIDAVLEEAYRRESAAGATASDYVEVISLEDEGSAAAGSRPGSGSEQH